MAFPDTRNTLIDRLVDHDTSRMWKASWEEFFDLYHGPVRLCVCGAFRRHNWYNVQEQDIQHVVMQVFETVFSGNQDFQLDASKGRFRQFITTVANRRVVDFVRSRNGASNVLHWGEMAEGADESVTDAHSLEACRREEEQSFRTAILGTLLTVLRISVSPQIYMAFELVKLIGESPESVAEQMGVSRSVVDNNVHKAMKKLREISQRPEIREEFEL